MDKDELSRWVAEYDAQGWHRTGSVTDRASADWLAAEVEAAGAAARLEPFSFQRLVHRRSILRLPDGTVPGVVLYDSNLPPAGGVAGAVGPLGSGADLGVTEASPAAAPDGLEEARRSGAHRAIVVVTRGQTPGLALRNAPSDEPYGPPVLQVASTHAHRLAAAAELGVRATVAVFARRQPGRAFNVEATVPGTEHGADPVVVLTPRSGWWQCAAERGGGLACWLAALGELARRPARRPVVFLATSGHELGHRGLREHLDRHPGLLRAAVWVHLGANIAASGSLLRVATSDSGLARLVDPGAPGAPRTWRESQTLPAPVGEASELSARGARFVSLVATNSRFHQPTDRYPENVDVGRLHEVARAVSDLARRLADAGDPVSRRPVPPAP